MSITVDVFHHSAPGESAALKDTLERVLTRITLIDTRIYDMGLNLEQLISKVSAIETVDQSVIALLGELKADLDAAIAKLPTDADMAALNDLSTRLGNQADLLAMAVTANTPAEPAPPPAEPPPEPPPETPPEPPLAA